MCIRDSILGILSIIVIPLIVWGISVETRFTAFEAEFDAVIYRIEQNEESNGKIQSSIDIIKDNTTKTLIEVEKVKMQMQIQK